MTLQQTLLALSKKGRLGAGAMLALIAIGVGAAIYAGIQGAKKVS